MINSNLNGQNDQEGLVSEEEGDFYSRGNNRPNRFRGYDENNGQLPARSCWQYTKYFMATLAIMLLISMGVGIIILGVKYHRLENKVTSTLNQQTILIGMVLAAVTNPTDSLREPQPRISPLPEGFIENARELLEYVGEPVAFITSETRDIVMAYPPAERRYDYDVMQTNLKDEVDGDVEEDDNGNILLISVVVS